MNVKKSFTLGIFVLFLSQAGTLFSQTYFSGNDRISDLLTPGVSSSGAPILSTGSLLNDSLNPALSALRQRYTLDFSYMNISGNDIPISSSTSVLGSYGHSASIGAAFPSKAGVFTLSANYLNGTSQKVPFGNQGSLNFSFSKDVYDDLLFGIGLNFGIGQGALGLTDDHLWSFGVDLGLIHMPGDVGLVKDFIWGVTLQNLGWGTLPFATKSINGGSQTPYGTSLFTLETALAFTAVEKNDFKMTYMADISFPAMVNMRVKTGFNFCYQDIFQFDVATTIDIRELAAIYPHPTNSFASLLPSFGFTYRYKPKIDESDDNKTFSELHLRSSAGAIGNNDLWAWGVGATIPFGVYDNYAPKIELFPEENLESSDDNNEEDTNSDDENLEEVSYNSNFKTNVVYPINNTFINEISIKQIFESQMPLAQISPNNVEEIEKESIEIPTNPTIIKYISPNFDGIQDNLIVPFNLKDKRFIKGYNFIIFDNNGNKIKKISNKEQRKENQDRNFFKRLFSLKKGITIPNQFVWNGIMESGETAIDGIYHFKVEAWDDNDNIGSSKLYSFVLDKSIPEINIEKNSSELNIFSPNNDGNKDLYFISQTGSKEDEWQVIIKSDFLGVIKKLSYLDSKPEKIKWDGKNDNGILVPDGVYHYKISCKDKAGNSNSAEIKNIIISTEQTPINITIDKSAMSPNSDGISDTILISSDIPVERGIVSWEMEVVDNQEKIVWKKIGKNSLPKSVSFNGLNSNGDLLNEGEYSAKLSVLYQNGNNPKSTSPNFIIDITPPTAIVQADYKVFSPDGDNKKDQITFRHDTSTETKWTANIKDNNGKIIKQFEWLNNPDDKFVWDGYLKDGTVLKDGDYSYSLEAIDSAGNSAKSGIIDFKIDTRETPVKLLCAKEAFSPNNDGNNDYIELNPLLSVKNGIVDYSLEIVNLDSKTVKDLKSSSKINSSYKWDGFANDGTKVEDGKYVAKLSVTYENGNEENASSRQFLIDTIKPQIKTQIDYKIFSPDGDGQKDMISIQNSGSSENKWTTSFLNSDNKSVKTVIWNGKPKNIIWDGTDNHGNKVKDGVYSYKIHSIDEALNEGLSLISNIKIDTRPTKLFLTIDNPLISPNNDKQIDSVTFKTLLTLKTGLSSWKLEIKDQNKKVIKLFKGVDRAPKSIIWDGKDENGVIKEGVFKPTFSAVYNKGNKLIANTQPIMVDISGPKTDVVISPTPFSPDNDGIDDEVFITFNIEELSGVEKWLFNIYDPKNRNFKQFKGVGKPASSIVWDGRSYRGDLVFSAEDYPYTLQMVDKAGNQSEVSGIIPVDVLVIKDGDRLKIQIANINFAPNSPKLVFNDPVIVKRNNKVLKRLSVILIKYDAYNITIEGHANALNWQNKVAADKEEKNQLLPLSKARAETVKNILIKLGVSKERLNSLGMGGSKPVVNPKTDHEKWLQDQWQNRRVEFILDK